jgi:uncharacterized protein YjbI with pentapeptide repeats
MAANTTLNRWTEIKQLWHDERFFYRVLFGALLVLFGIWLGAHIFASDATSYGMNLYTEGMSVLFTIGVLNFLADQREEKRNKNEEKQRLFGELRSLDNATALNAVHALDEKGWLKDGTMNHVNLENANLANAPLDDAVLENCYLFKANLHGAMLRYANLTDVYMRESDLSSAQVWSSTMNHVNLNGANLSKIELGFAWLHYVQMMNTNLFEADLRFTKLDSVRFEGADLTGSRFCQAILSNVHFQDTDLARVDFTEASFKEVNFDNARWQPSSILPNGDNYDPTKGIEQLERFTDPNHPDFWEPEWVKKNRLRMGS